MKRRTLLIGLGTVVATSGAALGTGAFNTVRTERSVSVSVAEDSRALVGIDVNDRYGGQTEDGVAEFDLQSKVFDGTGIPPEGETVLYGALAITNNSGIENDEMSVQLAYGSDSVTVPGGQEVPEASYDGGEQFYFRDHSGVTVPAGVDDPFEGLDFDGDPVSPDSIRTGETAVLDLVVRPKAGDGELTPGNSYDVDVTIRATLSGS